MKKQNSTAAIPKSISERANQKKGITSSRPMSGVAKKPVGHPPKGGCVKTVVLPHEDLNRLGI